MSGPEHFRAAQRLLAMVEGIQEPAEARLAVSAAGVHAQLAHVAALVDSCPRDLLRAEAWAEAMR